MEVIPNGNGIKILIIPNEYVINMIIVSHHGIKPSIITSIISMYLFFFGFRKIMIMIGISLRTPK
jgi:hypothetical protein